VHQAVINIARENQRILYGQAYGQQAVHLAVKNFPEPKSPELHISQNNQSQK